MSPMSMNGARGRLAAALAAFALPMLTSGCRAGSAQEAEGMSHDPVSVRAAPVERTSVTRPIEATGTFGPKDEIALSFKIGGVVDRVAVDAGATVHSGQVLASLDLREIDATLSKARTADAKAARDLERARRLYEDSVATLSQYQDAETAATMARADLDAAAFNRAHAVIVAPVDGVILGRSVEPGENVAPGALALLLGSRARGAVMRVGLADRDVVRIARGDSAVVRFDARPGRCFRGRVTEIGAAASPGTGTYAVEILLADAGSLSAGMVGDAEIYPDAGAPTAMVPVEAILEADGDQATAFVLSADGRHAERRRVTVAFLEGDRVAVTSGLENVASVVTDGAAWLDDGEAVRVIR
jgi:membrane fusion protein, multidrug efflux system